MKENKETSETLINDITKLCSIITIQQSDIFDIIKSEFPELYDKERATLVQNRKKLKSGTRKIKTKTTTQWAEISIEINTIDCGKKRNQSSLEKELNDPELFKKLSLHLRSFAESAAELEDIVQDAIIIAYEKRHEYDDTDRSSPLPWIYTIARNNAITYSIKKKKNTKIKYDAESELTNEERMEGLIKKNAWDTMHWDEYKESQNLFFKQINEVLKKKLSNDEISLLLDLYEGEWYEEIAKKLEIPLGTVKSKIHLARKKMSPYKPYFKKLLES